MVEYGILLPSQYETSRDMRGVGDELAAQMAVAATGGFDGVAVGEHHATEDHHYLLNESVLAYAASHLDDMWLASTVVLLPYHNPVRIAELGATLDVLSDGGFRLGVGLGYRQTEYDIFGVTREEAPGRLKEGIEVIERLWTQESVTYHGDHFRFDEISIKPQPLQDPRPPIWVGASNESSVRRAARIGDAFVGAHVPFDVARRQIADFRDERDLRGLDEASVGLIREAFVAETTDAAEARIRDPLVGKYESYMDWGQDDVIADDSFDTAWDTLKENRFLVGSPETVIADIERYKETMDLDFVIVKMHFPGGDLEDVRESIRLFGDRVIPAVR